MLTSDLNYTIYNAIEFFENMFTYYVRLSSGRECDKRLFYVPDSVSRLDSFIGFFHHEFLNIFEPIARWR